MCFTARAAESYNDAARVAPTCDAPYRERSAKPGMQAFQEHTGSGWKIALTDAIRMRLDDVNQLFETKDPFPFRERDLAKDADEYLVAQADELPRNAPIEIFIHLPLGASDAAIGSLDQSITNYFRHRVEMTSRELSNLFRMGRRALLAGLSVLAFCLVIGQLIAAQIPYSGVAHFIEEGLIIVGWVALWRPLEIFLYDWWPLTDTRKLYKRLAQARVIIHLDARSDTAERSE